MLKEQIMGTRREERKIEGEEKEILEVCKKILAEVRAIRRILDSISGLAVGGTIIQIGEDGMPTNLSLAPGVPGVFQANPVDVNGNPVIVAAPDVITFASNDPAVTVTNNFNGNLAQAQVTFPATGDTNTSIQLAAQITGPDYPTPVNLTPVTVSISGVTPPPSGLAVGGTITQIS
jgi:hypothetical protein